MTEHQTPADRWRAELRSRLLAARKKRDRCATAALRAALSAIDNAETPDGPVPKAGAITDSAVGAGSADVARRTLSDREIRALLRAEIGEREAAADHFAVGGMAERAVAVRAETEVLVGILGEL